VGLVGVEGIKRHCLLAATVAILALANALRAFIFLRRAKRGAFIISTDEASEQEQLIRFSSVMDVAMYSNFARSFALFYSVTGLARFARSPRDLVLCLRECFPRTIRNQQFASGIAEPRASQSCPPCRRSHSPVYKQLTRRKLPHAQFRLASFLFSFGRLHRAKRGEF
jgi:hypothetical protein